MTCFVDPEGEDPPEPLMHETRPRRDRWSRRLALNLEPYPRKPGIVVRDGRAAAGAPSALPAPLPSWRGSSASSAPKA
jgi:hypothetical protein